MPVNAWCWGQGGRGKRNAWRWHNHSHTFKLVCAHVNGWRWHSHNHHLEPGVCAYVNAWRWCNHNLHLETCVCAHVNAWRWHSDNLHLELCVCAYVNAYPHLETCLLMSMLEGGTATISMYSWTMRVCAYVNAWRWCNHNPYLETCVCVCPCQCLVVEDLLETTVESLLTDTPNKGHCIKYLSTMDTTKSPNFNPPINYNEIGIS